VFCWALLIASESRERNYLVGEIRHGRTKYCRRLCTGMSQPTSCASCLLSCAMPPVHGSSSRREHYVLGIRAGRCSEGAQISCFERGCTANYRAALINLLTPWKRRGREQRGPHADLLSRVWNWATRGRNGSRGTSESGGSTRSAGQPYKLRSRVPLLGPRGGTESAIDIGVCAALPTAAEPDAAAE
jgi:hypothetical protein